jgi:hypothetical protein
MAMRIVESLLGIKRISRNRLLLHGCVVIIIVPRNLQAFTLKVPVVHGLRVFVLSFCSLSVSG